MSLNLILFFRKRIDSANQMQANWLNVVDCVFTVNKQVDFKIYSAVIKYLFEWKQTLCSLLWNIQFYWRNPSIDLRQPFSSALNSRPSFDPPADHNFDENLLIANYVADHEFQRLVAPINHPNKCKIQKVSTTWRDKFSIFSLDPIGYLDKDDQLLFKKALRIANQKTFHKEHPGPNETIRKFLDFW